MKIETKQEYENFLKYLKDNAPEIDDKSRDMMERVCCTKYPVLCYKMGDVRNLAKEIYKDGYSYLLEHGKTNYYEEVVIRGVVLSSVKDKNYVLNHLEYFVKDINSWGICDSVITGFKVFKNVTEQDFMLFSNYALSEKEFYSRFGIMMIFKYCMNEEYLERIFKLLKKIEPGRYYVDMAIAWTLCELMIKFPESTLPVFKEMCFSKFIQNKAISKCHDSFRITDKVKEELKTYRIK